MLKLINSFFLVLYFFRTKETYLYIIVKTFQKEKSCMEFSQININKSFLFEFWLEFRVSM